MSRNSFHFPFMVVINLLVVSLLSGCGAAQTTGPSNQDTLTYLALGDSYTIGQSVEEKERWPVQLAKTLTDGGLAVGDPLFIAKTGWRTDNLMSAMDYRLKDGQQFDVVSLLIGVNNEYQGKSIGEFEEDFDALLRRSIARCKRGKEGVIVLSIPDYGATPFGAKYAKEIGKAIDQWNKVCKRKCKEFGIAYFDITDISRRGKSDRSLVASDGLHPSGKMYQLWVERIAPKILTLLTE